MMGAWHVSKQTPGSVCDFAIVERYNIRGRRVPHFIAFVQDEDDARWICAIHNALLEANRLVISEPPLTQEGA